MQTSVDAELDRLIAKRASVGDPEAREMLWKGSVRRHKEAIRRRNRAAWYGTGRVPSFAPRHAFSKEGGRGPKLMNRCLGTKRDNSPCTVSVEPPQTHCWWHDPANADKRKQAASKGGKRAGRGRPSVELARLQARFEELAAKVLSGEIERGVGAVAGQLLNGARACVRDGLAAREQEELIERLEALEEALETKQGARYGA